MELTKVIIHPYLTEKTYAKRSGEKKQYAFIVDIKANKAEIAMAFASIFNIEAEEVKTMVRKSVRTRTGTAHPGFTKAFKIAYITLPAGKDIALSKAESDAAAKEEGKKEEVKAEKKPAKEKAKITEKKDPAKSDKVETSEKKTAWRKATNKNH